MSLYSPQPCVTPISYVLLGEMSILTNVVKKPLKIFRLSPIGADSSWGKI